MDTPDDITKSCFETLLAATAADDYERFVSVGSESFKSRLKPEMFHPVCQWFAPRLKTGFTSTFFGDLRQQGHAVFFWRLRFEDGGDDLLFRMSMTDGKVAGALVTPAFSK
jgi:hypothetical protein